MAAKERRTEVLVPSSTQRAAGVRTVDAAPDRVPRNARTLAGAAAANGWKARSTYALARDLGTNELIESVAVRLAGPAWRGWAVWINGQFDAAVVVVGTGIRKVGYKEILTMVKGS